MSHMSYRFEWDDDKARANQTKHGISFDEASTVFDDAWRESLTMRYIPLMKGARSSSGSL